MEASQDNLVRTTHRMERCCNIENTQGGRSVSYLPNCPQMSSLGWQNTMNFLYYGGPTGWQCNKVCRTHRMARWYSMENTQGGVLVSYLSNYTQISSLICQNTTNIIVLSQISACCNNLKSWIPEKSSRSSSSVVYCCCMNLYINVVEDELCTVIVSIFIL